MVQTVAALVVVFLVLPALVWTFLDLRAASRGRAFGAKTRLFASTGPAVQTKNERTGIR